MSIRVVPYAHGYALYVDGLVSCYGLSFGGLAALARDLIRKELGQ